MGIWRIEKNSEERNLFGEKRNLLNLSKKDCFRLESDCLQDEVCYIPWSDGRLQKYKILHLNVIDNSHAIT